MPKFNCELIQNACVCQDGKILKSLYRHHYVSNGDCMTDGGLEYIRRAGCVRPIDLTTYDSFDKICENMAIDIHPEKDRYEWILLRDATQEQIKFSFNKLREAFPNGGGYVINITFAAMHFVSIQKAKITNE